MYVYCFLIAVVTLLGLYYVDGLIGTRLSVRKSIKYTTNASQYQSETHLLMESTTSVSNSNSTIELTAAGRVKTTPERRWEVRAVGVVRSPYQMKIEIPKQATITARTDSLAADGRLEIFPEFRECLSHLQDFDYIWAITWMHTNKGYKTKIRPRPDPDAEHMPPAEVGLFTSRAPHRPNPIAISALRIIGVNMTGGYIEVRGLDLLDDTPILDIKPYVPAFDAFPEARAGWMDMIRNNITEARMRGYQTIYSSRGARAARATKRKQQQMQLESDEEASQNSTDKNSSSQSSLES